MSGGDVGRRRFLYTQGAQDTVIDASVDDDLNWMGNLEHISPVPDSWRGPVLAGDVRKVSAEALRPAYTILHFDPARPEHAIPLYEKFISEMQKEIGKPVLTGKFGASMQVSLTNDGPVTIWIDSRNRE